MLTPVKIIGGFLIAAGIIYVGRVVYIKYKYPSHDMADASKIEPAGGQPHIVNNELKH